MPEPSWGSAWFLGWVLGFFFGDGRYVSSTNHVEDVWVWDFGWILPWYSEGWLVNLSFLPGNPTGVIYTSMCRHLKLPSCKSIQNGVAEWSYVQMIFEWKRKLGKCKGLQQFLLQVPPVLGSLRLRWLSPIMRIIGPCSALSLHWPVAFFFFLLWEAAELIAHIRSKGERSEANQINRLQTAAFPGCFATFFHRSSLWLKACRCPVQGPEFRNGAICFR